MIRNGFAAIVWLGWSIAQALVLEDLAKKGELESTLSHKKIGYYMGSFDPLHLGHESFVRLILDKNLCDYILICPASGGDVYKNRTDVKVRLEMIFQTFQDHPKVIVTKLNPGEMQHLLMQKDKAIIAGKPSVKTKIPHAEYIGVIGSDVALDIAKDAKKLSIFMKGIQVPEKYKSHTIGGIMAISVKSFIVYERSGDNLKALNGKLEDRPFTKLKSPLFSDCSSTKVKERIKNNRDIQEYTNPHVQKIISKYNLYKN